MSASDDIGRWLTASDADVGPACSQVPVPNTLDMTEPFREAYKQGYRHALADMRLYEKGRSTRLEP